MLIVFQDRASDSPFIERVWRSHSEGRGPFSSVATPHWEMVVSKVKGKTSFILRGPETKASTAECPADGEWVGIRFKLGTFMPHFPTADRLDLNNVVLPDAASRSFWLNGSAWEHPNFENAETFVGRLVDRELVAADPLVTAEKDDDRPGISIRTRQRRFLRIAGMARTTADQIERARRAAILLTQGSSILDAVFEAGYYDQAHLTRSLKHFVGLTPAEVARGGHQLSFLYNTRHG